MQALARSNGLTTRAVFGIIWHRKGLPSLPVLQTIVRRMLPVFVMAASLVEFLPVYAASTPQHPAPPAGVVQLNVPSNGFQLVCIPFEPFDTNINAVLAGQLTGGSDEESADSFQRWLAWDQVYTNAWRASGIGDPLLEGLWIDGFAETSALSSLSISAGDVFWLRSRQSHDQRVFLVGRVPLSSVESTDLIPGMNLAGYPYAASVPINETALEASGALAAESPDWKQDTIMRWRKSSNEAWGYQSYKLWAAAPEYDFQSGWYNLTNFSFPTLDQIRLGEGFWYKRETTTNAFTWNEPRPYGDTFAYTNLLPKIDAIHVSEGGSSVQLTIESEEGRDWPVDILVLDSGAEGSFTTTGWSHADRVQSLGKASLEWKDSGDQDRSPVSDVHARFYLVARADVDADNDGVSDALEMFVQGTDPLNPDTDGDGMSDAWELSNGLDPLDPADAAIDQLSVRPTMHSLQMTLGSLVTNALLESEQEILPSEPVRTVYVDGTRGDDSWTGRVLRTENGVDGPKRTVAAGVASLRPRDMLVIGGGAYRESLDVRGLDVKVRFSGDAILRNRPVRENAAADGGATMAFSPTGDVTKVSSVYHEEE